MQCKEVESVLERDGLELLPVAAQMHVETCDSCKDFVADLSSLVALAHELPAEVEPPARVWISLRNQLEAEGIIRSPEFAGENNATTWWHSLGYLLRGRTLAMAALALLLAFAAGVKFHKGTTPAIATGSPAAKTVVAAVAAPAPAQAPLETTAREAKTESAPVHTSLPRRLAPAAAPTLDFGEHDLANMRMAGTATKDNSSGSAVDTSLQDNLKQVDSFIAECEKHLQEFPQDELAREYLAAAYHQKAELISVMLDRGRSVN